MPAKNHLSISATTSRGKIVHPATRPEDSTDVLFTRGYALQQAGKYRAAASCYVKALKERKNDPAIYNNLGNCLRSLGGYDASIQCYDKALSLHPGRVSSVLNRSLALLSLGEYEKAWPGYEARLEVVDFRQQLLELPERKWKGERLGKGKTLYVYGNQGLGDEIQCFRFLSKVAERVAHVVLEIQRPLKGLTRNLPSNIDVIERGEAVPPFYKWCEIFSLPGIFQVTEESVPPPVRPDYLVDLQVKDWIESNRERNPGKLQVGIVWSGNPSNSLNGIRSCKLEKWEPLLSREDIAMVSLQVGQPSGELSSLDESIRPRNLAPLLVDFDATATAVDSLDLVITTDTSVPHLVGSLGKEGWVFLPRYADWRWGRESANTPWYPDLRLFRQKKEGDWSSVINRVNQELSAKTNRMAKSV
ncbi:MAG: hypothetical protein CMO55_28010 [Verrucomicrobiales bacterium]|nr:hypothetical protein [Verrucomicrobiales bacterium]